MIILAAMVTKNEKKVFQKVTEKKKKVTKQ